MTTETLIEEGIVLESDNGKAIISLIVNDNCHSCGAKPFCKPEDSEKNKLNVSDSFGVLPGDLVKISVEGKTILGASFSLYGIPLALLILSILIGMKYFSNSDYAEGISFVLGMLVLALYYLIFFKVVAKNKLSVLPKIISVKRN